MSEAPSRVCNREAVDLDAEDEAPRLGHSRAIAESAGSHRSFDQKLDSEAVSGRVGFVSSRFCSEMVSNVTGTVKLIFHLVFNRPCVALRRAAPAASAATCATQGHLG